jgi:ABC-type transporter Mla MlaB component
MAEEVGRFGTALAFSTRQGTTKIMLKIVSLPNRGGTATLVLEGRLIGPWVEELRRSCEQAFNSGRGLTLDLEAVSFVDRGGLDLLRTLTDRHARLNNCSPFVAEQLRTPDR